MSILLPEVLDFMHAVCPQVSRTDLSACWHNAHLHWKLVNPRYLHGSELNGMRTMFVLSMNHPIPKFRQDNRDALWVLLTPFCN